MLSTSCVVAQRTIRPSPTTKAAAAVTAAAGRLPLASLSFTAGPAAAAPGGVSASAAAPGSAGVVATAAHPRSGPPSSSRCMASAAPASDAATAAAAQQLPLVLVVAVALLDSEGRVLLAQRPPGKKLAGLWEFPGGKVDPGESPEAALVRELREELGIRVAPAALRPLTFASHAYDSFHLLMPTYECAAWEGEPAGEEGQALAWVDAEGLEAGTYAMPPADLPMLPPVLAAMRARRGGAAPA